MYKISAEDREFISRFPSWFFTSHGYIACDVPGKARCYMHRVVLARMIGKPVPKHKRVDHINGDKADNRRSNLRLVTPKENVWNRHTAPRGAVPYWGVAKLKLSENYRAYVTENGRQKSLGVYATPEEAAHAYNLEIKRVRGNFAKLNDVPACKLNPVSYVVSSSGMRGVRPHGNRWSARKKIQGKEYHVGVFDTAEEAMKARANFKP